MEQINAAFAEANISYLQHCIDQCEDVLKFVPSSSPEHDVTLNFTIDSRVLTTFKVGKQDMNFLMSFFMSWYSYYTRQLMHEKQVLSALRATPAAGCDLLQFMNNGK